MRWISDTEERTEVGESSPYASVRSSFVLRAELVVFLETSLYSDSRVLLLRFAPKSSS